MINPVCTERNDTYRTSQGDRRWEKVKAEKMLGICEVIVSWFCPHFDCRRTQTVGVIGLDYAGWNTEGLSDIAS